MNIDSNQLQANHNHESDPSEGVSCYKLDYSTPHEDSKESLSFLLEKVNFNNVFIYHTTVLLTCMTLCITSSIHFMI